MWCMKKVSSTAFTYIYKINDKIEKKIRLTSAALAVINHRTTSPVCNPLRFSLSIFWSLSHHPCQQNNPRARFGTHKPADCPPPDHTSLGSPAIPRQSVTWQSRAIATLLPVCRRRRSRRRRNYCSCSDGHETSRGIARSSDIGVEKHCITYL